MPIELGTPCLNDRCMTQLATASVMRLSTSVSILIVASWTMASITAAQDGLSFTLDEVEGVQQKPVAAPVVDTSAAIAQALGEVRWGMSKDELLKLLKKRIRDDLDQRIKRERDVVRQDALFNAAQEQARRLAENYVSFDGHKTGWDVSPVAGEFAQGNSEAMLVVANGRTRDMYFFVRGKLWKWYQELTDQDSDNALSAYRKRFGRGNPQRERVSETKDVYEGVTWADASTRLTVIRRGSDLCLIFEDSLMVEQVTMSRRRSTPKAGNARAALAIESILLNDAELKARDTRTY